MKPLFKSLSETFSPQKKGPHIFLHLHKCGGTTLMNCIDQNYDSNRIFAINGARYRDSYNEFKALPKKKRTKIDLLRGHHFFGSHAYLRDTAVYFTMVREPYDRLASLYNYLRHIDLYTEINQQDMDLAAFLDSGLAMAADNGMARMLTANDFDTLPNGEVSANLASEALENITSHFAAVGIMEEFDASLQLFKQTLGWEVVPSYEVKNKLGQKQMEAEAVKDFFETNPEYKRYIHADVRIYEEVRTRFVNLIKEL